MLSTPEFAAWSKNVVLFLHNTSRVTSEPYPNLLYEKGGNGFPTVSYLDARGNLLKQVGHVTPVEELEQARQDLMEWQQLKARFSDGDESAEKPLFLKELAMQILDPVHARTSADLLDFSKDERARIEGQLVNLEFQQILRKTPRNQMAAGGRRFVEMYRLGRIPTSKQDTSFWQYMFEYAKGEGDADLFEELLVELKKRKADDPRLKRYLQRLEAGLKQLRGGGRR